AAKISASSARDRRVTAAGDDMNASTMARHTALQYVADTPGTHVGSTQARIGLFMPAFGSPAGTSRLSSLQGSRDVRQTGGTTRKRILVLAATAILSRGLVRAQSQQPYRVVFDLTSRDSLDQKAVLRWLKEITTSSPDAKMEVVMYAKGFEL